MKEDDDPHDFAAALQEAQRSGEVFDEEKWAGQL